MEFFFPGFCFGISRNTLLCVVKLKESRIKKAMQTIPCVLDYILRYMNMPSHLLNNATLTRDWLDFRKMDETKEKERRKESALYSFTDSDFF